MAFRGSVQRALGAPVGGTLAQVFSAPRVMVIVADARGGERDVIALTELVDALARVGTPRGRLMVLLAGAPRADDAQRERARHLRTMLGMPVVVHDPERPSPYVAGNIDGLGEVTLDDELREAEGVIVVGRFSRDPDGHLHGGPGALLPGLAGADTRRRFEAAGLPDTICFAALDHVEVDFALVWDAGDPPRVLSGEGRELFARCVADGWVAIHARSR